MEPPEYRRTTRTKKAILVALILLLIAVTAAIAFAYWPRERNSPRPAGKIGHRLGREALPPPPEAPPPATLAPLTGLPTTPEKAGRRPLAVMIENYTAARPQSGLDKADLIYEAVAEGGITRFVAVFMDQDAGAIGPVRSARDYYVGLARQYDAIYVHAGGSPGGFAAIRRLGVADMDQFANGPPFWRIRSRKAPHNLYSSTEKLWKQAAARGYTASAYAVPGPPFKEETPAAMRPKTASIDVNFSGSRYRVKWSYDPQTNSYLRSQAGAPHKDAVTGRQLSVKNVIVQYARIRVLDSVGRVGVSLVGTGKALVFSDGRATAGTWRRSSLSEPSRFYDAAEQEIKLNPGKTWIEIVDPSRPASYASAP